MREESKPSNQSHGFWASGEGEYLKGLREEETAKLQPLKTALKEETDRQVQAELKAKIRLIRREYKDKRKAARGGLFSKA